MSHTETLKKFCKLRMKNVILSKETEYEIGRKGVLNQRVKCLVKDDDCKQKGCKYAPAGIGDIGKIDPFEES
jgi:hypothetical protein